MTPEDFKFMDDMLKETRSIDNYNMRLKFKKIDRKAVLPSHSKNGDAGMDLTAVGIDLLGNNKVCHYYGVSVEIPEGNVGLLFPRSSIHNSTDRLSNSVGVIDSGYRGEIMAVFDVKSTGEAYKVGDRTAQLVIVPFVSCNTEWSDELSETERGLNGYGSTGR